MQQKEILSVLQTAPLFANVEQDVLARILKERGATFKESAPGELLRTDSAPALGVLLKGRASILSASEEKELILREIAQGEIFDAASLFLKDPPPLSRIVAKTPCTTLFLDVETIRRLMSESPAFLDAYLSFLADRVQFLNAKIRCYTAGSAERRLALYLSDLETDASGIAHIDIPLSDLCEQLDIGRASLYRAFGKLCEAGLIERTDRTVRITDPSALLCYDA